jgi:hypothetical protein
MVGMMKNIEAHNCSLFVYYDVWTFQVCDHIYVVLLKHPDVCII